ncbi:hypothetical protein IFO70_21910 [Phormidium tenue FACHB-886]|nr:hypothetical protein [Phormidium tenue FACHB-886]
MNDQASLVLKVLLFSALISIAIKYVAPSLAISATNLNALIAVLLPSGVMAIVLSWRGARRSDEG